MKKNTIITIAVLGAVGYWIYSRNKAKKSLNPFARSSSFAGGGKRKGCEVYAGNVSTPIPWRLDNGDIIVKTGGGTTVVCPPNQQGSQGATSLTN
jgi:hypothetical protein